MGVAEALRVLGRVFRPVVDEGGGGGAREEGAEGRAALVAVTDAVGVGIVVGTGLQLAGGFTVVAAGTDVAVAANGF